MYAFTLGRKQRGHGPKRKKGNKAANSWPISEVGPWIRADHPKTGPDRWHLTPFFYVFFSLSRVG
jgi:hypothetical protein